MVAKNSEEMTTIQEFYTQKILSKMGTLSDEQNFRAFVTKRLSLKVILIKHLILGFKKDKALWMAIVHEPGEDGRDKAF